MKLIFLKILFKIIHKVKLINNKLINLNVISSKILLNKINSKIYLKCRKKYMMMIGLMKMMVKIITILYKLV